MPLGEAMEWSQLCADLVREFNSPPDEDDKPKPPREYVKRNGLYVPR